MCYVVRISEVAEKTHNITQEEINNNLVIHYPMLVEPKA